MAYNPMNQYMGPQIMQRAILDERAAKEKQKADEQMAKGFRMLHAASPELQRMVPVRDWGDFSPNQIRGIMGGIEMLGQQAQMQQRQQEMQAQQAMAGFRPRVVDAGNGRLAMMTAPGRATPLEAPFRPEIVDMGGQQAMMTSPRSAQLMPGPAEDGLNQHQKMKMLESLMTRPIRGNLMTSTMRLGDYIEQVYGPNATQKPDPVAEEILQQANALSMQINGRPVFVPAANPAIEAAPAEDSEPKQRGLVPRAIDWALGRGDREAAGGAAPRVRQLPEPDDMGSGFDVDAFFEGL